MELGQGLRGVCNAQGDQYTFLGEVSELRSESGLSSSKAYTLITQGVRVTEPKLKFCLHILISQIVLLDHSCLSHQLTVFPEGKLSLCNTTEINNQSKAQTVCSLVGYKQSMESQRTGHD